MTNLIEMFSLTCKKKASNIRISFSHFPDKFLRRTQFLLTSSTHRPPCTIPFLLRVLPSKHLQIGPHDACLSLEGRCSQRTKCSSRAATKGVLACRRTSSALDFGHLYISIPLLHVQLVGILERTQTEAHG